MRTYRREDFSVWGCRGGTEPQVTVWMLSRMSLLCGVNVRS